MKRVNIILHQIIFIAAILLPILYLISLMRGFYFTGDTVSFLQFASAAGKYKFWDVFLIHLNPWPPLTAIFYNLLQFLPGGYITEQKFYLILFFLITLFSCYFLVKEYFNTISDRIIATSLITFSSLQVLLFLVSLADGQFMAGWILALLFLNYFIQTKKERYVALFLIPASLIPLTRYAGLTVTITLSTLLVISSMINLKTKKYSIFFIILAAIFTLIPISFYLFRNFIATNLIFGYYDPQYEGVSWLNILLDRIKLIISDIWIPFLIITLFGTRITWKKNYLSRIILFMIPILIYLSVVIIQQYRFRVTEFIPSRYTSPFYPILFLICLLFGSWLSSKFPLIKKIPKTAILIFTLFFFMSLYNSSISYLTLDISPSSYRMPGAEYSYDVQKFCNIIPDKKRYLFLQYDSRNWVAQGIYYFCQPIDRINMTEEKISLPKDSLIISPYEITLSGTKKIKTHYGQKNINLYLIESETELNIKEEIAKLHSILE